MQWMRLLINSTVLVTDILPHSSILYAVCARFFFLVLHISSWLHGLHSQDTSLLNNKTINFQQIKSKRNAHFYGYLYFLMCIISFMDCIETVLRILVGVELVISCSNTMYENEVSIFYLIFFFFFFFCVLNFCFLFVFSGNCNYFIASLKWFRLFVCYVFGIE